MLYVNISEQSTQNPGFADTGSARHCLGVITPPRCQQHRGLKCCKTKYFNPLHIIATATHQNNVCKKTLCLEQKCCILCVYSQRNVLFFRLAASLQFFVYTKQLFSQEWFNLYITFEFRMLLNDTKKHFFQWQS